MLEMLWGLPMPHTKRSLLAHRIWSSASWPVLLSELPSQSRFDPERGPITLTVGYSLWNNSAVATDWLLAINNKLSLVRLKSRRSGRTARCAQSSCATIRFSSLHCFCRNFHQAVGDPIH